MSTSKTLAALLIFASVTSVALAKGPAGMGAGAGMGGGANASAGTGAAAGTGTAVGTQTRTQLRDPALNTTGTPLQMRDRIHTPAPAPVAVPTVLAPVPAN